MKVLINDDPFLRVVAKPLGKVTLDHSAKIENMFTLMYDGGIGLAATQVGWDAKVFITDVENYGPMVFINPMILKTYGKLVGDYEGCLSFPGKKVWVERKLWVKLSYEDFLGNKKELVATKLMARCIQHELQHLDGIVITDYEKN